MSHSSFNTSCKSFTPFSLSLNLPCYPIQEDSSTTHAQAFSLQFLSSSLPRNLSHFSSLLLDMASWQRDTGEIREKETQMRKRRKEEENGKERGSREEERCREKYLTHPANPHSFYPPRIPNTCTDFRPFGRVTGYKIQTRIGWGRFEKRTIPTPTHAQTIHMRKRNFWLQKVYKWSIKLSLCQTKYHRNDLPKWNFIISSNFIKSVYFFSFLFRIIFTATSVININTLFFYTCGVG